ncbi:hypothetical protein J7L87_00060 [bacterium]|nr:hypothetical protein [bacterium]
MKTKEIEYITQKDGRKVAVIVPIKEYEKLIEDIYDLGKIAERKREKEIEFEKFVERLKEDGLL